jgi:hypothetical protein
MPARYVGHGTAQSPAGVPPHRVAGVEVRRRWRPARAAPTFRAMQRRERIHLLLAVFFGGSPLIRDVLTFNRFAVPSG